MSVSEVLELNYCLATNQKQPNTSGHARGRKLHHTLDGKLTVCNMKVEKLKRMDLGHFICKQCKICFKKK